MLTNPPVHYDICVSIPISHLLTVGGQRLFSIVFYSVLLGTFNQEKAQLGAFSVIVKTDCETDGSSAALLRISG